MSPYFITKSKSVFPLETYLTPLYLKFFCSFLWQTKVKSFVSLLPMCLTSFPCYQDSSAMKFNVVNLCYNNLPKYISLCLFVVNNYQILQIITKKQLSISFWISFKICNKVNLMKIKGKEAKMKHMCPEITCWV